MVVVCCIVGCRSRSSRDKISFFRIPSRNQPNHPNVAQVRKQQAQWLKAIKRNDLVGTKLKNSRVCSKHFHSGKPANALDQDNVDWAPCINLGHKSSIFVKSVAAVNRQERHARRTANTIAEIKERQSILTYYRYINKFHNYALVPNVRIPIKIPCIVCKNFIDPFESEIFPTEKTFMANLEVTLQEFIVSEIFGIKDKNQAVPFEDKFSCQPCYHSMIKLEHHMSESRIIKDEIINTYLKATEGLTENRNVKGSSTTETIINNEAENEDSPDESLEEPKITEPLTEDVLEKIRYGLKPKEIQGPFVCEYCGVINKHKQQFKLHLRRHTRQNLTECPECDKKFVTNTELRRHFVIHTGEKPYRCQLCNKTFPYEGSTRTHLNQVHSIARNAMIMLSDKSFVPKEYVTENMLEVHHSTSVPDELFELFEC